MHEYSFWMQIPDPGKDLSKGDERVQSILVRKKVFVCETAELMRVVHDCWLGLKKTI